MDEQKLRKRTDSEAIMVQCRIIFADGKSANISLSPECVEAVDQLRGLQSRAAFFRKASDWGEARGYGNRSNGVRAYVLRLLLDERADLRVAVSNRVRKAVEFALETAA